MNQYIQQEDAKAKKNMPLFLRFKALIDDIIEEEEKREAAE